MGNNFEKKIRQISNQESLLGHFVNLIYYLLANTVIMSLTDVIFAVIIFPILITSSVDNHFTLSSLVKNITFLVLIVVYIVIKVLSAYAINYSRRYRTTYKAMKTFIKSTIIIFASWSKRISNIIRKIEKDKTLQSFKKIYLEHSNFVQRASFLCKILYELIETAYKINDHQITIMHKLSDDNGLEFIKMIAYYNKDDRAPGSFRKKYYLDERNHKPYYHVKIFNDGRSGIKILNSREEIEKRFVFNKKSKDREDIITQYIGIPILDCEGNIIDLVQIDLITQNVFGRTKNEIDYIATNLFLPLCNILKVWYNKNILAELINTL